MEKHRWQKFAACGDKVEGKYEGNCFLVSQIARAVSKAFDRVWHTALLNKLKSYGISGQIFGLVFSFLSNRRLQVVLDGKSSQEYPVNAGVPQGPILGPTIFQLHVNDLPDDVICDIAIYADDATLYSKCDQASHP